MTDFPDTDFNAIISDPIMIDASNPSAPPKEYAGYTTEELRQGKPAVITTRARELTNDQQEETENE